jgi:hypothetical protein
LEIIGSLSSVRPAKMRATIPTAVSDSLRSAGNLSMTDGMREGFLAHLGVAGAAVTGSVTSSMNVSALSSAEVSICRAGHLARLEHQIIQPVTDVSLSPSGGNE